MRAETLTDGLARFATGVTVLAVQDDSEWGDTDDLATTVTAFMPVSLEPPVVAVAVIGSSYVAEVLAYRDLWALSVLAAHQTALAGRFAAAGRPGARLLLAGTPHHRGSLTGGLLLDDGCAAFECRTVERSTVGDHLLLLGEVLDVVVAPAAEPLVRFGRGYRALSGR